MLKPWQTILIVVFVVALCMCLFFSKNWPGLHQLVL